MKSKTIQTIQSNKMYENFSVIRVYQTPKVPPENKILHVSNFATTRKTFKVEFLKYNMIVL